MNQVINTIDLDATLQAQSPQEILAYALGHFDKAAISFSGSEDVVLIDMAVKVRPDVQVFCLDTGRLHEETYRFLERVRKHYGVTLDILSPDAEAVRKLVTEKGLFSFYEDTHKECCAIRKIGPLKRNY